MTTTLEVPPGSRQRDGAEATVSDIDFLGVPALKKVRVPKSYRPADFDDKIRTERLRAEVRILREARRIGVRTPRILDIQETDHTLVLERIGGRTLTEMILGHGTDASLIDRVVRTLGSTLGKLHTGGLSHGDLTGSNMIWTGEEVVFIDMSMGSRTPELEDFGIDLHLVEEDFNTLSKGSKELYKVFLDGYDEGNPAGSERVRRRAAEIKGRIRYS